MAHQDAAAQLREIMVQYAEDLLTKPKKSFEELEMNRHYPIVQFKKLHEQFGFKPWIIESSDFTVSGLFLFVFPSIINFLKKSFFFREQCVASHFPM